MEPPHSGDAGVESSPVAVEGALGATPLPVELRRATPSVRTTVAAGLGLAAILYTLAIPVAVMLLIGVLAADLLLILLAAAGDDAGGPGSLAAGFFAGVVLTVVLFSSRIVRAATRGTNRAKPGAGWSGIGPRLWAAFTARTRWIVLALVLIQAFVVLADPGLFLTTAITLTSLFVVSTWVPWHAVRLAWRGGRRLWGAVRRDRFVAGLVTATGLTTLVLWPAVDAHVDREIETARIEAASQLAGRRPGLVSIDDRRVKEVQAALLAALAGGGDGGGAGSGGRGSGSSGGSGGSFGGVLGALGPRGPVGFDECVEFLFGRMDGSNQVAQAVAKLRASSLVGLGEEEDLIQETLISVCSHHDKRPYRDVQAVFHKAVRNAAYSYRKRGRIKYDHCPLDLAPSRCFVVSTDEKPVLTNSQRRALQGALCDAPERDRALLLARFREGLSYRAIGAQFGQPESWARNTTNNAIKKLRRRLETAGCL